MLGHALFSMLLFLTATHSLVLHPTQRAVDSVESYSHRHWVDHGGVHTVLILSHSNLTNTKLARLSDKIHKRRLNHTHEDNDIASDYASGLSAMLQTSFDTIMGFLEELISNINQTKETIHKETRKQAHNELFY